MQNQHSFIILAYQESPYLEACVQSLLQQTVPSQIILVTATPNAFIEEVAARHQLPLIINRQPSGLASDWNFALRQARTEYVTLAHQDDIYLPDYSAQMLNGLSDHPDFLIKFCNYQEIYHGRTAISVRTWTLNLLIKRLLVWLNFRHSSAMAGTAAKMSLLRFGSPIACPSILYHTNRLGDFAFSQEFQINADWMAWIDLAHRPGAFLKTERVLMQHRIHADSATTRGLRQQIRQREDLLCFAKLWPQPLVKLLYKLYTISYRANAHNDD